MNGTGYGVSNSSGIEQVSGTIETSGTGTITLNGTSGNAGSQVDGLYLQGHITTVNGNITINGNETSGITSGQAIVVNGGNVYTTGTGNIALTATGNGVGGVNIYFSGAGDTVGGSSDNGNITFTTNTISSSTTIQTTGNVTFSP